MAKRRTLIQQSRAVSSKVKAGYHELTGAGRRRVRRPFFGLSRADEDAAFARIATGVEEQLSRSR